MIRFCPYFFQKMPFFYIKINILDTHLLWGISREEIFENLLRLMRFGVYFETKMAISIKKNNYSLFALICARGSGAYAT